MSGDTMTKKILMAFSLTSFLAIAHGHSQEAQAPKEPPKKRQIENTEVRAEMLNKRKEFRESQQKKKESCMATVDLAEKKKCMEDLKKSADEFRAKMRQEFESQKKTK
jgi:hypothetical protein